MKLLFSLTKKDFEIQTFCTGGKGGQHRNAKQNGVRIIHTASGARAEHRDGRDQAKNKEAAFKKLVATPEFKLWHKVEVAKRLGQIVVFEGYEEDIKQEAEIERAVDRMIRPENLRIETF
jgi:hypothetical protein